MSHELLQLVFGRFQPAYDLHEYYRLHVQRLNYNIQPDDVE